MNILFVTPFYYELPQKKIGLMRLTEELSKYAKVIVLSAQVEGAKKYEESGNLKIYRVKPLLYLKSLPYTFTPFLIRDIINIYKKENIDVVIAVAEQFWSSFMAALAKGFIKNY